MRTVIGVMGSGRDADAALLEQAYAVGAAIAREGWTLLNGGRSTGVMDASARGASEAGGLVVGVLPDEDARRASAYVDVAVCTGLGDARNVVNVLSSRVVVAMRGGYGTMSEIALALNAGKTVVALGFDPGPAFDRPGAPAGARLVRAGSVDEAIAAVRAALEGREDR